MGYCVVSIRSGPTPSPALWLQPNLESQWASSEWHGHVRNMPFLFPAPADSVATASIGAAISGTRLLQTEDGHARTRPTVLCTIRYRHCPHHLLTSPAKHLPTVSTTHSEAGLMKHPRRNPCSPYIDPVNRKTACRFPGHSCDLPLPLAPMSTWRQMLTEARPATISPISEAPARSSLMSIATMPGMSSGSWDVLLSTALYSHSATSRMTTSSQNACVPPTTCGGIPA